MKNLRRKSDLRAPLANRGASKVTYTEIAVKLADSQTVHLVTHVRGDADSASVFALALALQRLGKTVSSAHDLPEHLSWLLPSTAIPKDAAADALLVALDTGNFGRLALDADTRQQIASLIAEYGKEAAVPMERFRDLCAIDIVIDHHESNWGYGAVNLIDAEASSTAEMLTVLLQELERITATPLFTEEICQYLYTGIASDTQWFKRDTSAGTYTAAAFLEAKVRIDKIGIAERLDTRSFGYFKLGQALRKNARSADGLITSYLDLASLREAGIPADEAAQMTEELERLPGRLFVLFVQLSPVEIRVRLRGRGVPVLELARQFGGGGHEYRAGAVIAAEADMDALLSAARSLLAQAARP